MFGVLYDIVANKIPLKHKLLASMSGTPKARQVMCDALKE